MKMLIAAGASLALVVVVGASSAATSSPAIGLISVDMITGMFLADRLDHNTWTAHT